LRGRKEGEKREANLYTTPNPAATKNEKITSAFGERKKKKRKRRQNVAHFSMKPPMCVSTVQKKKGERVRGASNPLKI